MKASLLLPLLLVGTASAQQRAQVLGPPPIVDGVEFGSWEEFANSPLLRTNGLRCGAPELDLTEISNQRGAPSDCNLSATMIKPEYEPGAGIVYQIPVVFHVIHRSNNAGKLAPGRVQSQIDILNEDYRALPGTNGAGGTDVRVQFYLATEDPMGNPTNGIVYTENNDWFNEVGNYKGNLNWDPSRYLNIYSVNTSGGVLGYATIPSGGGVAGGAQDGVTLLYAAVGRNALIGPPYDQGRTATHEVGHYLGLLHTFQGGCGTVFCQSSGDLICDTNPENAPRFGCPGNASSCNTPDPVTNYMDYTDDLCMTNFTPNQANRMRCTMENFRSSLHTPICSTTASASVRNAGSNPNVLSATPPVMGAVQEYTITTSPHDNAILLGYLGMGMTVLSGGQTILLDLGSGKLFQSPLLAGPNAVFSLEPPVDIALCGAAFSTQAALLGGVKPFSLTNAVDHVIGGM